MIRENLFMWITKYMILNILYLLYIVSVQLYYSSFRPRFHPRVLSVIVVKRSLCTSSRIKVSRYPISLKSVQRFRGLDLKAWQVYIYIYLFRTVLSNWKILCSKWICKKRKLKDNRISFFFVRVSWYRPVGTRCRHNY